MIWRRRLGSEWLNQELIAEILWRAGREPSQPSYNRGGWRSPEDLLIKPVPAMEALHELVRAAFDDVCGGKNRNRWWVSWAVVNRNGSHHERHAHQGAWSGIYYVTTSTGDTLFELPGGVERVTPEAGLFVITPANVYHSVEACNDAAPRITIGFEAR